MADPRCFLRPSLPLPRAYQSLALFPSTGGFLPPAPLRASSLWPLAVRLGVGALSIRFDKSPLKKIDDGNPDTLPLLIYTPWTTRCTNLRYLTTKDDVVFI